MVAGENVQPIKLQYHPAEVIDLANVRPEVTEWDQAAYRQIVATDLTAEQRARIATPGTVQHGQTAVVGLHWHPEFVPLDMILARVHAMFPARQHELVIPTQHNELITLNGYAGVEIDCYSEGFNRKVQLLAHFAAPRLVRADVFRSMLVHTFKYRASQLWEYIDSVIDPRFAARVQQAAVRTGASEELVRFAQVHVTKLKALIDQHQAVTPPDMLKNKLVRNYVDLLREQFDARVVRHAQVFLQAVKNIVKAEFRLDYFYRTREVIEEVRGVGGCLVIPHPEQFWPILLADYDVDGIEVWNPQSREYTEFLINVVHRENQTRRRGQRPLLVTMGDDTHFGEKVIRPEHQDPQKADRELGVQPAWDEASIRKSLILANMNRPQLIEEYQARLG